MTVSQRFNEHKHVPIKNYLYFLAAHEVPYWCSRKQIWRGKSDFVEIIILTELVSLKHKIADGNADTEVEIKDCFAYFWERFRINKLQMQRASCRLHLEGVITRSFREVIIEDQAYKELDIKLNISKLDDFSQVEVC